MNSPVLWCISWLSIYRGTSSELICPVVAAKYPLAHKCYPNIFSLVRYTHLVTFYYSFILCIALSLLQKDLAVLILVCVYDLDLYFLLWYPRNSTRISLESDLDISLQFSRLTLYTYILYKTLLTFYIIHWMCAFSVSHALYYTKVFA